jgi:hypothetical protein
MRSWRSDPDLVARHMYVLVNGHATTFTKDLTPLQQAVSAPVTSMRLSIYDLAATINR